ncbi:hypothetical protein [Cognatishimia sp.]|uniref:hypothetical protein n=1 Tax=Cognatishimia sp. TaxID=2211648 RepID=UPI003517E894|nr:hypothetical protein [Cognatishimia sp.]NQY58538.1 hypothetical protein [Cognatishimia sp.]
MSLSKHLADMQYQTGNNIAPNLVWVDGPYRMYVCQAEHWAVICVFYVTEQDIEGLEKYEVEDVIISARITFEAVNHINFFCDKDNMDFIEGGYCCYPDIPMMIKILEEFKNQVNKLPFVHEDEKYL